MQAIVVDDDPDVRALAARVLERAGFNARGFACAEDALRHLDEWATEVDLVLTDVTMPGAVDGLGLARRIGRERPGIAVLVMSGCPNSVEDARAIPTVAGVIAKPFAVADLQALARAALPIRPPRSGELTRSSPPLDRCRVAIPGEPAADEAVSRDLLVAELTEQLRCAEELIDALAMAYWGTLHDTGGLASAVLAYLQMADEGSQRGDASGSGADLCQAAAAASRIPDELRRGLAHVHPFYPGPAVAPWFRHAAERMAEAELQAPVGVAFADEGAPTQLDAFLAAMESHFGTTGSAPLRLEGRLVPKGPGPQAWLRVAISVPSHGRASPELPITGHRRALTGSFVRADRTGVALFVLVTGGLGA